MYSANILLELVVLLVCVHAGYGIGKPHRNAQIEQDLSRIRKPYVYVWFVLALSGISLVFTMHDFTMVAIASGLIIGYVAARRSGSKPV